MKTAEDRVTMDSGSQSQAQRLKPLAGKAAGTLVIHEIYRSLQGEEYVRGAPLRFRAADGL